MSRFPRSPLILSAGGRYRLNLRLLSGGGGESRNSLCDCDDPVPSPVLPADSYVTWDVTKPVRLRMVDEYPGNRPPTTVQAMFRSAAQRFPDHPALGVRRGAGGAGRKWQMYSYAEYLDNVVNTAKAFKLGGANTSKCFTSTNAKILFFF